MDRRGMTLLEVMIAIAVLAIVAGMLFMLAASLSQSAKAQEAKSAAQDEARNAMMVLVRDLRQAFASSIAWGTLPGPVISYQVPVDADGNGVAVDVGGFVELSPLRQVSADLNDVNGDGQAANQLIMTSAGTTTVIGAGLLPNEDVNANGVLEPNEDINSNGRLDRGIWFERVGSGIRITIQTQHAAAAQGLFMNTTLREIVVPRN